MWYKNVHYVDMAAEPNPHWPKAGSLHECYDHLPMSKMLINLKAAAFSLESLCILHAKICISALILIQVSNSHHPNSINPVIIQHTSFINCKCYIHLSSFHPLHVTKTLVWQNQIKWHYSNYGLIFTTLIRICDIERDNQNQKGD